MPKKEVKLAGDEARKDDVKEVLEISFLVAQFGCVFTPRSLWSSCSSNGVEGDVGIYVLDKMVTGEIPWNNRSLQESPMRLPHPCC